LSRYLKHLDAH